jgi:cytochrome c oxidase subunit 1
LTDISAVGGFVLFASALFFLLVMVFTLFGPRAEHRPLEFADPMEPGERPVAWLDRLGVLTAVAVVLVLAAYAYPLWHHLQMVRFGSPGFTPF